MTGTQRKGAMTIGIPVAVLIVIYVANWAVGLFAGQRYVTREEWESSNTTRAQFDSLQAQTLRRIDARVADIYCGQMIPAPQRPGCR